MKSIVDEDSKQLLKWIETGKWSKIHHLVAGRPQSSTGARASPLSPSPTNKDSAGYALRPAEPVKKNPGGTPLGCPRTFIVS